MLELFLILCLLNAGLLASLAAYSRRQRHLHPSWYGLPDTCCRVCRYDLTGNVSAICPECGTPIAGGQRKT